MLLKKKYSLLHRKTTLTYFILMGLFFCVPGCKNANNKDAAASFIDETYYMKLKAADVKSIFQYGSGDTVKQMIFTWTHHKKRWALEVFGADSKGNLLTTNYVLEVLENEPTVKNPGKLKRNPQLITRGDIKDFLGQIRGTPTPIPTATIYKDMYFKASLDQDPRHPGKKLLFLFYSDDLSKLGAAVVGDGATKPSPPAVPCDTMCDY